MTAACARLRDGRPIYGARLKLEMLLGYNFASDIVVGRLFLYAP